MTRTRSMRLPDSTVPGLLLGISLLTACAPVTHVQPQTPVAVRDSVTLIGPRCAGTSSCLLGRVTAAESGQPLSQAAVFLEPIGEQTQTSMIIALTDDQGVFTIENPPLGNYRLAVYKQARHAEVRGLELGAQGTVVVPVMLAP